MKQPARDQLGEAGQNAVMLFFNDLGWGPLPTGKHDLGTDLFVQVRAPDLVDLGTLLGVQVKTGDSWFRYPAMVDGKQGWWFRERDRAHEAYWVNHHIPHLLVVQDSTRKRRFWARLDRSSIRRTAKGLRVFVPGDQQLDDGAATEWTRLAATAREGYSLEGARWKFSIRDVPEEEWARYALVASRIVAPHPNQGISDQLLWPEAVALCLQATPHYWDDASARHAEIMTPAAAADSTDAGWRFASAVHQWMNGDASRLKSLVAEQLPDHIAVARSICLALILLDADDRSGAIELLQSVRSSETSLEQAWVAVQLGWAYYEDGSIAEAREQFASSLAMHDSFASGPINSAIRSAGILALFDLAPDSGDLAAAVQAFDTTLSWWRAQQFEAALNDYLRRGFRRWANDRSRTLGGGDVTHNELVSAEWSARLVGNQRASRYARYLRSVAGLSAPGVANVGPSQYLELLRRSGYPDELALAVRNFRSAGPLDVVADYMAEVTLASSTPTSIRADLKSLDIAGSYLSSDRAQEWIPYLLRAVMDPTDFSARFNLEYWPAGDLMSALAGLQLHLTATQQVAAIDLVFNLGPDASQLLERPAHRLIGSVKSGLIESHADAIVTRALGMESSSWVRRMLLNMVAQTVGIARDDVRDRIMRGELTTLPNGFTVDSLSQAEGDAIIAECARVIDGYAAPSNATAIGGLDPYYFTAQLAVYGPTATRRAAWDLVTRGIAERDAMHERKTATVEFLAEHRSEIPPLNREQLRLAALDLMSATRGDTGSLFAGFFGDPGPAFAWLYLELADPSPEWDSRLTALMSGNSEERRAAIRVMARRTGYDHTLLALTRESDTDVRAEAVQALAFAAAGDGALALKVRAPLLTMLETEGEEAAIRVGSGILSAGRRNEEVEPLIAALRHHASLHIRSISDDLG